jgi:hypothetical protein
LSNKNGAFKQQNPFFATNSPTYIAIKQKYPYHHIANKHTNSRYFSLFFANKALYVLFSNCFYSNFVFLLSYLSFSIVILGILIANVWLFSPNYRTNTAKQ